MSGRNEFIVFGDPEAMTVAILTGDSHIAAFRTQADVPIDKITTDLVGFERGMTWVEVAMEGGSYKFHRTKRARIDVTVYSPLRRDAYALSALIQAVMFSMQASYTGFGLNYQACQIETDIFKSNEKDTAEIRYIQSLRLLLKPL